MKNFKKIIIYYLISALLLSAALFSAPHAAAAQSIDLKCGAAVLADLDTGTILYSSNGDARMHPASLTKIMTAIVAIDAFQSGKAALGDTITLSPNLY